MRDGHRQARSHEPCPVGRTSQPRPGDALAALWPDHHEHVVSTERLNREDRDLIGTMDHTRLRLWAGEAVRLDADNLSEGFWLTSWGDALAHPYCSGDVGAKRQISGHRYGVSIAR
jgi:hypothetical protein